VLTNLQSTGLYFGCHDGIACHAVNILIRGNLIHTVQPGDGVGYGLEIKLNSYATIIENTVYGSQGPGIEVYGSNRGDPPSLVERNYVEGAQTDAGINVGGGPAIVRNNIVVGNQYNGIWAQDYNGRGLQQNVWIVQNTVLNNQTGGIKVTNWQAGGGPALNAGADRVFAFAGQCGIPLAARSVAINIAVTQPTTGPGFLSFYPGGTSLPLVSMLNYSSGQTRANNAIVPLGAAGDMAVHCGQGSGTAQVIIDVSGYFQ